MNIGRDTYNTLENMVRPITGRINVSGVIASNIPREMVPIYGLNNEPLTRRIEENAAELINASISGVIGSNNIRGMTNNVTILDEAQPLLSTISSENTSGNELVTREYMDNVVSTGGSGWGATNYYSVANSNTNNTSFTISDNNVNQDSVRFEVNGDVEMTFEGETKRMNLFELVTKVAKLEAKVEILMKDRPKKLASRILNAKKDL